MNVILIEKPHCCDTMGLFIRPYYPQINTSLQTVFSRYF